MEGEFWFLHSLAGVNRETGVRLARRPGIEVSFAPTGGRQFGPEVDHRLTIIDERTFANLSGPAHIHLRHFYPPRLNPPIEGLLVVILAWEYGFLPIRWIPEMLANVAEFWCYSEAIRQTYIASGIPSERLFVIPLGADSSVFRPDGPKHIFTDEPGSHRLASLDEEPFIFLFCGGVQARKSADLIEQAMLRTFAPGEPVVCVIKDFCSRTVYRGGNGGERFRALAMDDSRPVFIYMDEDLTPMQLPR
jgi:glycosyltransferase involved in cell wall biosynthesis